MYNLAMPFDIPAENKQHVNLSKRAWRVIEHDMVAFMGTDDPSLSGFLNRIITNFHENSKGICSQNDIANNFGGIW